MLLSLKNVVSHVLTFLVILKSNAKIVNIEAIEKFVSVEISNPNKNMYLHSVVVKHIMHGLYDISNPNNVCMKKDGTCKGHYPKVYYLNTYFESNDYPKYKRIDNGQKVKVR